MPPITEHCTAGLLAQEHSNTRPTSAYVHGVWNMLHAFQISQDGLRLEWTGSLTCQVPQHVSLPVRHRAPWCAGLNRELCEKAFQCALTHGSTLALPGALQAERLSV